MPLPTMASIVAAAAASGLLAIAPVMLGASAANDLTGTSNSDGYFGLGPGSSSSQFDLGPDGTRVTGATGAAWLWAFNREV
jgi:hypothetical protein